VLEAGKIHDSNTPMLSRLFAEAGIEVACLPPLRDDPAVIRAALLDASAKHDLVVTCGGASVGERDFVPRLAADAGTLHFWRVRVRPGMPVLCASIGDALLVGLPGNPVSAFCGFHAFVRPALELLGGRTDGPSPLHARLDAPLSKSHDRHELRRGLLRCAADGMLQVSLHPHQGSHQLSGIAGSNALVHLPAECRGLDAGALVAVQPYGAILAR
jgi:molybdopterin molybdotransferase